MSNLFVTHTDGQFYIVPSTLEVVPRDYDCALATPASHQQRICNGDEDAWPKDTDPKCVVVLIARLSCGTFVPFWFSRLSLTPHVLRRIPRFARHSIRKALESDTTFRSSTLVTHYVDNDYVFDPSIQRWNLYDQSESALTSTRDLVELRHSEIICPNKRLDPCMCVICADAKSEYVALPCGHLAFCRKCAQITNFEQCPLCRSAISYTTRIFGL